MTKNWKERRKIELIRHLNHVLFGIMVVLLIGLVGTLDIRHDLTGGQYTIIGVCIIYICAYCYVFWYRNYKDED